MTTNAIPTVILTRISDDRVKTDENGHKQPRQGLGVADQETRCRAKVAQLGGRVVAVVTENDTSAFKRAKVRLPNGATALRTVRPKFRETVLPMLADGRADMLVCLDLDRAMRDPKDLEDLLDVITAAEPRRVRCDSVEGSLRIGGYDDTTGMSMARLLTAVANKSSSDTSRRVRAARQRQAENGQYGGGRRPFGFGADGVTVIESEAAEIRTAAAAVLAEGDDAVSLKAIARDLRDRGVPTVTGAKWTAETLRDVLMKPRLAGLSIHRGTEIEITGDIKPQWMRDPILPVEQWRAVMARLTDPARTTGPGNAPRWLLSGIALCGVCADGTSVHVRGGRPQVPGYCCQKRSHLRRSAYAADAYVGMVLCARLAREDAADLLTPPGPEVDGRALRAALVTHRAKLIEIADDYDEDRITRAQRDHLTAKRRAKIAAIEVQLAAALPGPDVLDGIAGHADAEAIWDGFGLERQRAIVRRLAVVTLLPATRRGRGFEPDSVRVEPRDGQLSR